MQKFEENSFKTIYRPLVSVAVTTYNSRRFIVDCIRSIWLQSYTNYEIILVDDCSTDITLKLLESTVRRFSMINKIKIFSHSFNCGYGQSLKHAIEFGEGELVVIVDSDDTFGHRDALKMLVEAHYNHPEASLVYSDYWACYENLKLYKRMRCTTFKEGQTYLGEFDGDQYLGNNVRVSHVKCFKRSFYDQTEGVDSTLLKSVDKDLVLKLEEVGKLHHIPIPLYLYRLHENSITRLWYNKSREYKEAVHKDKLRMYRNARDRRMLKKNENIS